MGQLGEVRIERLENSEVSSQVRRGGVGQDTGQGMKGGRMSRGPRSASTQRGMALFCHTCCLMPGWGQLFGSATLESS